MDARVGAGGAYGAGKASGRRFDPITFVQKPQVILRLVCWLFALIQFTCLASGAHIRIDNKTQCLLKDGNGPCSFLVFIGVMAFLETMVFLTIDALFDNWSNVNHRKYAVLADLGFSAAWTFLWFLAFCINISAWKKTTINRGHGGGKVSTAIAFSFFSIFTWAGLAVMAFLRYRQGSETAFAPSYEPSGPSIPPANPYSPSDVGQPPAENYQQPPFSEGNVREDAPVPAPYVLDDHLEDHCLGPPVKKKTQRKLASANSKLQKDRRHFVKGEEREIQ